MNKYQKAFWNIIQSINDNRPTDDCGQDLNIIQELVDKATPKKIAYVKIFGNYVSTCPTCTCGVFSKDDVGNPIMYKAKCCANCGQELDWSDFDD
jgi:hypothetical protein